MATQRRPVWVTLNGLPIRSASITEQINGPTSWTAEISGRYDDSFAGVIRAYDGDFVYTSPTLKACTGARYSSVTKTTTLSGLDLVSWKLSQPNQSLPTTRNSTLFGLISLIQSATGISIQKPTINLPVAEEDLKQENWWAALLRYAEVSCCNLLIREDSIVFAPFQWTGERIGFRPTTQCEENINSSKNVTGFVINKRTSHHQAKSVDRYYSFDSRGYKVVELRAPVDLPVGKDVSTLGSCTLVGFWAGHPNNVGSRMIAFQSMGDADGAFLTTPIIGPGPATHMTLSVKEPIDANLQALGIAAKIEVSGSTPQTVPGAEQPDLDLGFTYTVGTVTGPNARPGPVRNEPLYPSAAYCALHSNELLWEANKNNHQQFYTGAFDGTVRAGCRIYPIVEDFYPDGKAYSVTHNFGSPIFTTSISCHKIQW